MVIEGGSLTVVFSSFARLVVEGDFGKASCLSILDFKISTSLEQNFHMSSLEAFKLSLLWQLTM